jgi:hypothetical protein
MWAQRLWGRAQIEKNVMAITHFTTTWQILSPRRLRPAALGAREDVPATKSMLEAAQRAGSGT